LRKQGNISINGTQKKNWKQDRVTVGKYGFQKRNTANIIPQPKRVRIES
jgi:hypothetical protein